MRADTAKSDRRRDRLGRRGACTPREKADGATRRGRQTEQLSTAVVALGRCKPAIRRMCGLHCDAEGREKIGYTDEKMLQISTKVVVFFLSSGRLHSIRLLTVSMYHLSHINNIQFTEGNADKHCRHARPVRRRCPLLSRSTTTRPSEWLWEVLRLSPWSLCCLSPL